MIKMQPLTAPFLPIFCSVNLKCPLCDWDGNSEQFICGHIVVRANVLMVLFVQFELNYVGNNLSDAQPASGRHSFSKCDGLCGEQRLQFLQPTADDEMGEVGR